MQPKRHRSPVVMPTASYSFPLCCALPTTLGVWGWRCGICGEHLPFRDDAGLTFVECRETILHQLSRKENDPCMDAS